MPQKELALSKTKAARRLQLWFRRMLSVTFKKFLKRRTIVKVTKDILYDCVDAAVIKGLANEKLKRKWEKRAEKIRIRLLKERAAFMIQRMMRRWYYPRLLKKKRALKQRRDRFKSREAAKAAKIASKASGDGSGGRGNNGIGGGGGGGGGEGGAVGAPVRVTRIDSTSSNRSSRFDSLGGVTKVSRTDSLQSNASTEEEAAAAAAAAARLLEEKKKEAMKPKRIFKDKKEACLLLQRCLRGCLARQKTYRRISSAMRIQASWRKYSALVNLQQSVRRVERPLSITVKSLSNISGTFLTRGTKIKVKISVWWHPLLHILYGDKDLESFLTKEKPQISWTAPVHPTIQFEGTDGFSTNADDLKEEAGSGGMWDRISSTIPRSALGIISMMRKKPKAEVHDEEDSGSDSDSDVEESVHSSSKRAGAFSKLINYISFTAEKSKRKSPNSLESEKRLKCDFNDTNLKIPACHGNSVIRFEFITTPGDKKFCHYTLRTKNEDLTSMLYWGGDFTRSCVDALAKKSRGAPMNVKGKNISTSQRSSFRQRVNLNIIDKDAPVLAFSVVSGHAGVSRADSAKLRVTGNGEVSTALRRKDFMESILSHWFTFFVSLDHDGMRLLTSRRSITPFYVIDVKHILDVRTQLGSKIGNKKNAGKCRFILQIM